MTNIAVVGCGYWGMNYVRVFSELTGSKIVLVADKSEERLQVVRERFPLISTTRDWTEAVTSRWIDAVAIATPASSHFTIARRVLTERKHVLIEKPLTTSFKEGTELVRLAQQNSCILMVGHTFLYNSGLNKVKELMSMPDFGEDLLYSCHSDEYGTN